MHARQGDLDPVSGRLREVWVDGSGEVRLRDASRRQWPHLFDRVAAYRLPPQTLEELRETLVLSGFFRLPGRLEPPEGPPGAGAPDPFVAVSARLGPRIHQTRARGRTHRALDACLEALSRLLPERMGLSAPGRPDGGEAAAAPEVHPAVPPAPGADLAAAVRFHEEWLAREPSRVELHLDLYALHRALGDRLMARRHALALRDDPHLAGLVEGLLAEL